MATTNTVARNYQRWNFAKMDIEKFQLALEWSKDDSPADNDPAEVQATWLDRRFREACDLAAPKAGSGKNKRQAFW